MLVTQDEASKLLDEQIDGIGLDKEQSLKFAECANNKFNIPTGDVMDYLSKRKHPADAGLFDLFILSWTFDKLRKTKLVEKIFTDMEIREFSNAKIESKNIIKFPLRIRMLQVDDEQWIGATDVHFFMSLRNSQLINYNVNAQRTMRRYVRGGQEKWRIQLNKTAVNEIAESYADHQFVPNTITLNIPEDELDFYYDENNSELVFRSLKHFDISDGYHRYMGMAKDYDNDNSFNYPMELRITHFSDDKVKGFIFQEDQKTKMRKIDSNSMNMSDPANLITERVNDDVQFIFKGGITRNESIMDFGEFASVVKYFFKIKSRNKATIASSIMIVKNEIVSKMNQIFDDPSMIKEHYDFTDLMIIFTAITEYSDNPKSAVLKGFANKDKLAKEKFGYRRPRRAQVTEIESVIGGKA